MDIFATNELAETVIDQAHSIRLLNRENARLVAELAATRSELEQRRATEIVDVARAINEASPRASDDASLPPAVDGSADDGPDPQVG